MSSNFQEQFDLSYLSAVNQDYIDDLYEQYIKKSAHVPKVWQDFFASLSDEKNNISHADVRKKFKGFTAKNQAQYNNSNQDIELSHKVLQLINAYRLHGHQHASLDPLSMQDRKNIPDLELEYYGLNTQRQEKVSLSCYLYDGEITVEEIYNRLRRTYAGNIGVEYMHITDNEETSWLQQQIETAHNQNTINAKEQKFILEQLTAAYGLEKYLGSKYVGQKRFSLEGCESLIPALNTLVNFSGSNNVKEIIIGMAHRGRLNVLVNVLGKSPEVLFQEFEGSNAQEITGDVKYHMGFSADVKVPSGEVVHLGLAFNPSHLEIIAPVVQGSVRARQRRRSDVGKYDKVIPVIIHGDAAVAGQGVVMETMNFARARGYNTGGSIHIIINNQIGFTTSNPLDSRSTLYSSDIAKVIQAPIFHVNADDPEAVVFVTKLAFLYRAKFKKDIVIDLVCYRQHGHNEADDPTITQPLMYQMIKQHENVREVYAKTLANRGVINSDFAENMLDSYRNALDEKKSIVQSLVLEYFDDKALNWEPYLNNPWDDNADTSIPKETIIALMDSLNTAPKGFTLHPNVKKLLTDRQKMAGGDISINWGFAEMLAYASLLDAGYGVRLSGQDSGRGTFSHRHAIYYDYNTGEEFSPLSTISDRAIIIDSVLSEEGVLAFEYGFALAEPLGLVIWEAQFGDFANGAQVVIDQFISSGEQKWGRMCGLTMLLPHGFEGQGPEHSSARLERFLQLCAQENIQVCVPTTPSQIFHLLRRQMIRPYRKPLIVMTPKSLLRNKLAVSTIEDFTSNSFKLVIDDVDAIPARVENVIICSGKIYYELLQAKSDIQNTAIIRLEQLYPFPLEHLTQVLSKYQNATKFIWCQEEPQNQGAWYFIRDYIGSIIGGIDKLNYVGRTALAAPAEGSSKVHKQIQQNIIDAALNLKARKNNEY